MMQFVDQNGVVVADNSKTPAIFNPKGAKKANAKADALINLAKQVQDWPLLETAVDAKLEQQAEFVTWWRENVRGPGKSNYSRPGIIDADKAHAETGITALQVSKWSKRLQDRAAYRAALYGAAWRKAMAEKGQTDQRGASGTGENEWYTPDEYLNAAREVLGEIDLDPASSEAAQAKVRAAAFFTKETDGLKQEWVGRVWLNPPYAQPLIADFVAKMVAERQAGRVTAAIMLTHNYTDTAWFHLAASVADAVCFTRGRVKFYDASGATAAPTQGQAFHYFGDDVAAFAERFSEVGFVVTPFTGEIADE